MRVTMMLFFLGIWINITAVSSAVWEHNALVWFWTKTFRSNDSGPLLALASLVISWSAEWIQYLFSFITVVAFGHVPLASSWLSLIIFTCRQSVMQILYVCERNRTELLIAEFDESLTNSSGVWNCQMRRFMFVSGFWQTKLDFCTCIGPDSLLKQY